MEHNQKDVYIFQNNIPFFILVLSINVNVKLAIETSYSYAQQWKRVIALCLPSLFNLHFHIL